MKISVAILTGFIVILVPLWSGLKTFGGYPSNPDVGVTSITRPLTVIDSGLVVVPEAIVANFGDTAVEFPTIFKDELGYYIDTFNITLPPGMNLPIHFRSWTVNLPRGSYTIKCSTALPIDINRLNDAQEKPIVVRVRDIGITAIVAPADTVDSGLVITPKATLRNLGSARDSFPVKFRIGTFYDDTRTLALSPASETTLSFSDWNVSELGTHPLRCSLGISDLTPHNNVLDETVTVVLRDVGIAQIIEPRQTVDPHSTITPKILVRNYGSIRANFSTFFEISDIAGQRLYSDTQDVSLEARQDTFVDFRPFRVDSGLYIALSYCRWLADRHPENDTLSKYFFAGIAIRDVGVSQIISPKGTITAGNITPKAAIKNFGNFIESFTTFFTISQNQIPVYFDSLRIANLTPGATSEVSFSPWRATYGTFLVKCSTALVIDTNLQNDFKIDSVKVETLTIGWLQRAPVPDGPKAKKVKSGGSLVFVPTSSIYAFKGNNTNEFYRYDITQNTWETKETIPYYLKKKRVKGGGALCYDGERYIYALKGGNTKEFWRYNTRAPFSDTNWKKLADVPGEKPKVKDGAGLAFGVVAGKKYIFLLKASKSYEFYAYDISADLWIRRQDAPPGRIKPKPWKKGSCLTKGPGNYLYALKGDAGELYRYNTEKDSWRYLDTIPRVGREGKKRKPKAGASIAYSPETRKIYILKGGNTKEFWSYAEGDSFRQGPDILTLGKGVKDGGALVSAGHLYALVGNKSQEFLMYNFGTGIGITEPKKENRSQVQHKAFTLYPNPSKGRLYLNFSSPIIFPMVLRIYNSTGRLVKELHFEKSPLSSNRLNLIIDDLPFGVYILKVHNTERNYPIRKFIICR